MEYNSFTDSFSSGAFTTDAQPEPRNREPQIEIGRGGVEVNFTSEGGMVVKRDGGQSFEAATGFTREGDLMSTACSPTGSPIVSRSIQPTDTIEIGGMRTTVAVAEREGFIRRQTVDNGAYGISSTYVATDLGQQMGPQKAQPKGGIPLSDGGTAEEAAASGFKADDNTEALLADLNSKVDPSTMFAALNSVLRDGEVDTKVISRMAQQTGMDPAVLLDQVTTAQSGMYSAVTAKLATLGVHDEDVFSDFINSDSENQHRVTEAIRSLMTSNSTKGFEDLAADFTASLYRFDPDAVTDALDVSGVTYTKGYAGSLLVALPGVGQLTYEQAVKGGFLKVSRA
ncbi:MAG: hypothetical protein IKE14_11830 [Loktanella sp.]|nr:hypothetical protein [Loktanella sp.]